MHEAQEGFTSLQKVCRDCSEVFMLSADEQAWFADKGLSMPVRCHRCRQVRRAAGLQFKTPQRPPARRSPPIP
jgi:hypothetical protein